MGRQSKEKGKRGERLWAIFTEGVRTWEHLHDVFGAGRFWEVKFEKDGYTRVYDALEEHALHYRESGDGPVPSAAIKQNGKPWIVAFYAEDWLAGNANPSGEPKE
jgi:hypothetical protein